MLCYSSIFHDQEILEFHDFVVDNFQQDKSGLFKLNLSDGNMSAIFTPGGVDVSQVKVTSDEKNVYAVASEDGFPTYHLINNELKEAQVFKQLVASFPDQRIDITSRTEKGDVYIVRVSSDIEAGQFYIFDLANNKLSGLFKFIQMYRRSNSLTLTRLNLCHLTVLK